jgi:hypothetical protein
MGGSNVTIFAQHSSLAWALYFSKLTIEVDGESSIGRWGSRIVDLPPGRHEVKVFFRYLFKPRCGEAAITVEVLNDVNMKIEYRAPALMSSPGKLRIVN